MPTRKRALFLLVLLALTAATLAAPAGQARDAADSASATGATDALGRILPSGAVGPVLATGTPGMQEKAIEQPRDVRFETVKVASDYGPESYKGDHTLSARTPDAAENATTNWDNALGHHITFTVEVSGDQMNLGCDDRFVPIAYIQTTGGRLYGWTNSTFHTGLPGGPQDICLDGLPGVRIYEVVFDLDGAPPTVTGSIFPALLSGFYVATLELYHHVTPGPTNPSGQGPLAGLNDIGFMIADPQLTLSETTYRFPEATLRMFSGVGGHAGHTHQYLMPHRPLAPNGEWTLTLGFPGTQAGTKFTRVDHFAYRLIPGVNLPVEPTAPLGPTPLDPLLAKILDQTDRLVTIERVDYDLSPDTVPESRRVDMTLRGSDFQSRSELLVEYVPLHVVTILLPASLDTYTTGAESIVIPVSTNNYPLRELNADEPLPGFGTTNLLLQDSARETGGLLGLDAGDAWALRPIGAGHDAITRSTLQREAEAQWVTGTLRHIDFPGDVPRYRLLLMLYGPLDEFLGYRLLERGLHVEATDTRFVEGRSGEIEITVRNLGQDLQGSTANDVFEMRVTLSATGLPDGKSSTQNLTLSGGEARTIRLPLSASTHSDSRATITATSGELEHRAESLIEVISRERAREEERKWYHIPAAGLVPALVALLAVAALLRRRM